ILQAKTGSGKSVMSLYIASALKVKTLVVATKEVLMEQWLDYIKRFLPKVRAGVVRQDIDESSECDICVGMIHSLSMKRYDGLYDKFGLVIWDEVHRVGADVFSETAKLFRARYRLGVSATVKRWDGADNVFLWSIGDVIKFPEVPALIPSIYFVSTDFALPQWLAGRDVALEFLLKFLIVDDKRNNMIVDFAVRALEKGRKVLILSHRRKHLKILYEKLAKKLDGKYTIGFVVGGMKQAELVLS
ncbi:MAG: DEAD/DEAH box helicase family protein, partial [Candidatus Kryptonium sp.]